MTALRMGAFGQWGSITVTLLLQFVARVWKLRLCFSSLRDSTFAMSWQHRGDSRDGPERNAQTAGTRGRIKVCLSVSSKSFKTCANLQFLPAMSPPLDMR